jgi:hypothetical protein
MGTRVVLAVGVAANDVGCPVEVLDAVGEEPADVVLPEANELESCELHPTIRIPATARAAPVSNVW